MKKINVCEGKGSVIWCKILFMLLNLPSNLCYKLDIRECNSSSVRLWLFADIDCTHSNFGHIERDRFIFVLEDYLDVNLVLDRVQATAILIKAINIWVPYCSQHFWPLCQDQGLIKSENLNCIEVIPTNTMPLSWSTLAS